MTRFIVFGNEKILENLPSAHLFGDGTFDVAPHLFTQLYTIHALIEDTCVPVVFALLPR